MSGDQHPATGGRPFGRGFVLGRLNLELPDRRGCLGNRFGLVFVDYPTQRRVLKASVQWYRQLIEEEATLAAVAA